MLINSHPLSRLGIALIGALTIGLIFSGRVTAAPIAPVVTVSFDGTGDYNCDGTSDQLHINQALAFIAKHKEFTTVYLKGPHTYLINGTVFIDSDTTLTGDAKAVIKLIDHARWPKGKSLIQGKGDMLQNITICGFEVDANDQNNYDDGRKQGTRYYTMLSFNGIVNLNVHHMFLHNGMNDGLFVARSKKIMFRDNVVDKPGHNGIYCYVCEDVTVCDNKFNGRTNNSIGFAETNHAKAYRNVITAEGGGAGIQVQRSNDVMMDDVEIYENRIYRTKNAGILVFCNSRFGTVDQSKNVRIHNNIIYECGWPGGYFPAGILIAGFQNTIVENNVIDGCSGAGIAHKAIRKDLAPQPQFKGLTTIVRNNIITNTKPHKAWGTGAAIWNELSDTHSFKTSYNCYYNNAGGNYSGVKIDSSHELLDKDPLYLNGAQNDYHLKPKSPCVNAGDPASQFENEPKPNGKRIDIGAYGNTAESSK